MYTDEFQNNFQNDQTQEDQINQGLGIRSLFVVGDDAQSIYAFRGSKIEIILGFENQYPMTTEIILNQNYRSNQQILDLAEKVLTHNPNQKKKELFTDRKDSTEAKHYTARNERDEAEFIIRKIHELYVEGKDLSQEPKTEIEVKLENPPKIMSEEDKLKAKIKAEFSVENLQELLG